MGTKKQVKGILETLCALGYLLERAGEYKKAETTLYNAAHAAGESRDGLLAAKAIAWLVWVVGYRQARHEAGLLIARDAEVLLGVAGGSERIRARLLRLGHSAMASKSSMSHCLLPGLHHLK